MSFESEYLKLRNERQGGSSGGSTPRSSSKSSNFEETFMELRWKRKKKKEEDDIAPFSVGDSSPFPLRTTSEEKERKWFDSGAFDDGYQFGDVSKVILGTLGDLGEHLVSGVAGMGEAALDAAMWLAPAATTAQNAQNSLAFQFDIDEYKKQQKDAQEFIQKDLYDEEKVAKAIISNPMQNILNVDTEEDSLLGEKTDSLVQSAGQLGATIGLQAIGVPWWLTTGATTFGGEVEGAFNEGANYDEAGLSAAVAAGSEILTEKLSGGIKFGGKALDDVLTNQIARNVSNKAVRTLLKLGQDMVGEGAEEVLSGVMSAIGQKMTYADDKELNELFSSEEAWESFIGGAALGGTMGGINAIRSNSKGVDYVSELTTNEQKVVEQVYKDRVAEAEEKGKVSQKEKAKIYDQVLNDMEKGYISTDTIESVLGGEAYQQYKNAAEWEKSLQDEYDTLNKEYDELYNMKNGDKSSKQADREAELKERLPGLKKRLDNVNATSTLSQMREKIGSDVFGLVKGDRLAESYNERSRRGQAFEADLTQYDQKQQETIKRAVDSGILNNTNRTHEFVDFISKISADKGVLFDFTNNEKLKGTSFARGDAFVNGYYDPNSKTVGVNIDSAKAMDFTVGHEITHVLEGTKVYGELQNVLFEYAKTKGEYDSRRNALSKLYSEKDIDTELAADLVGDYIFSDPDFVRNLSTQNRNVFQKIYDEIKYLCKVVTAGSKEARQLEKVKREFEKAYREGGKAQSETKYSLTAEQQEFFKDSKVRDENGNLKVMYHGTPNGDFTVFKDGTYFTDNKEYADTYQNPGASSISTGKEAKNPKTFEVYLDIKKPFDINDAEARRIYINDYIKGGNAMGINPYLSDSEYAKIKTIDWTEGEDLRDFLIENEYDYDGLVLDEGATGGYGDEVKSRGKSYVVFSPEQVKNIDNLKPTSDPDIRYSLSDSATDKAHADAVKNRDWDTAQKMVDEAAKKAGYTKAVYHGTESRFTVFDTDEESTTRPQHAWMADYPDGTIFLAEDYDVADQYGDRVMEMYLDTSDMKVFEEPEMYAHRAMDDKYGYEVYNYNVIAVKGKDMTIYATLDNTAVKSSLAATYDDNGNLIPLSERFKHSNPDIRFSLSKPVEETKDLIAMHNLQGEQLLKSLELGGLPMPSIAIIKAADGHNDYGEVSLILRKDAIDPQVSRANKIYGGDAWTPTYPKVEYKPNAKVEKRISDKYYGLARQIGYDAVRPMYNYVTDLERQLNNAGGEAGMLKSLYDDTDMMNLYLQDSGKGKIEPIEKETVTKISPEVAEMNQFFIDALGEDVIAGFKVPEGQKPMTHRIAYMKQHDTEIRKAYERFFVELYDFTEAEAQNAVDNTAPRDLMKIIRDAYLYTQNNGVTVRTEIDSLATNKAIQEAAADGYKEWVDGLFKGVEEKTGIRNNQDYFTRSGNRRSWDALHWENTLENVVKAMKEQQQVGTDTFFGGTAIFPVAAKSYKSIAEVKADSHRLRKATDEEYEAIKEAYAQRFQAIAERVANKRESNRFIAWDNAMDCMVDAVRSHRTVDGVYKDLKGYSQLNVTKQDAADLVALVEDIAEMPTGYFEAKPQRAVGFDEVGVFVIPYDADVKLKQELLNRGYSIAEYDPKVEGDRQRVVNGYEEYKFSLSNVGEQHTSNSLSALRLDAPVVKNSTTAEDSSTVAENETVAPTVSETESVREMFPDDGLAEQGELEDLISEEAEIRGVMEAYAGVGDIEAVNKLIPEHEKIQNRIRELQSRESERAESLTDADVPPEMDAPYSVETENYDPFADTGLHEISRSTRSYSDRNPGARIYLEEAALGFLYDVENSTHGERWYNDQVYYESGGEKGFGGTKRHTTTDIADLKDTYGYTWDELRDAAKNVAQGDFRSVAAKRVEYLCHKRLMEGYTDVDGRPIPANEDYISFLNETFANEQRVGGIDNLLENAEQYAPEDIAPVIQKAAPVEVAPAPIFESKEPGTVKGQTSLFEAPKPGGKTANVLTNEPKAPKRRNKFWSMVKEHILDNGMVFEDLSKETGNREIEAKWNFIRYSQSRAQRLIGNGTDGVKSLKDIKKTVESSGKTGKFFEYLYHKHNVDRMSLEDRFDNTPNKAVFGDSVTAEVSQRKADQFERMNPEFMTWAEDVYGYMNHLRSLLVENDVISQETADLWEKMYPHYVPIRRAGQDGLNINVPLDSRKTGVNNPVKRATGGNQDILPLFDTMAQRTIQTYKAIAKNSFGIELKNTLGTVVDQNPSTVDDVIDGVDTDNALLKPGENGMNPTFTVFENGERVEFEITEEMYEAMKPKSEMLAYRNKVLNAASNVFRGLTTQYSIPFMATNAIKDAQDVLINSQHPAKTYANFPRAWYEQLRNGKYYQEYIEHGGEDNTYFDNETNTFKEDNAFMGAVKLPLKAISTANNFIEMTPRLAEYIASREAGRSIEVSMLDAARVTTNFAAGGDFTKFLNGNGATFLNASVQGAVQQVRNIREANANGLKGWVGLATKFALAGLPAVLLNNMLWDDDEDYEELADYVKDDYYVIAKYDDGKFIRIPKGRTVAVIQKAIDLVQDAATGNDEVDLMGFLTMAAENLAPNNPMENNILAPIMQAWQNETWYGEELVPSRLQDLPAAEQYDEKTDNFSRWLGETLNVSPYKINYLLNQYSGGIGDVVLPMMTPRAESGDDSLLGAFGAPLRDKFTTDSVINSQVVSDFYDTKDALSVNANASGATEEDYFKDLYMDSVGYELSDLYKQKREIQSGDLSDSEKYTQSRELQKQIVERMKEGLDSYNNIYVSGNYAEVGDKRYNKDADSDKWYEIKPKNKDGSDNYYYQKEQEVTKGLGITPEEYWNNREEYNYAYDKPDQYTLSKVVGGYESYRSYSSDLWDIKADKDENGKSINGSRKEKVLEYINNLDADYGEKIILFKNEYNADNTYNYEIVDYLNSRDDISYEEMESILRYLGFEVDEYGNISWD